MNTPLATILIASLIAGIASYGASATYRSWERRNNSIRAGEKPGKFPLAMRRLKKSLLAIGAGGIGIAIVSNFSIQRDGLLYAKDLSVINTPPNLIPTWTTSRTKVKRGDLLAKFEPTNPSLQVQSIATQNSQLAEKSEIEDKINTLTIKMASTKDELKILDKKYNLAAQKVKIAMELSSQGALAKDILVEREAEAETVQQQILKLENSLSLMEDRKNSLSASLNDLLNINKPSENILVSNPLAPFQYSSYADSDGEVMYRSNAFNSRENMPLLVIGKPDSVSFQVRLPNHESESLKQSKTVYAEWIEGRELGRPSSGSYITGIPKRFPVNLVKLSTLDGDSENKLALLSAKVPPRAIINISRDQAVAASLVWKPSLYYHPMFRISLVILFFGIFLSFPGISEKVFSLLSKA